MKAIGDTLPRRLKATASGSLSGGDTVIVNSDGTVSVVASTVVSEAVGTPEVFESATTVDTSAAYDANAQKVVIAYQDSANSEYGTAVVGTVDATDNSISFGTPVVFESVGASQTSSTYDANAQKVVIAYRERNSDDGKAVVGTVSGTSISFGAPVAFDSGNVFYISSAYDTNAQKVVIAYQDSENSNYGTAIVGTVSGTSISFGTAVVFESAASYDVSAAYDANAQKVVIAYRDFGNTSDGTAIVGTVSGTSISFGTPVVFESGSAEWNSAAYDANAQKVVIAYRDGLNSNYGTAVVGTVSGTSVSFGTPVVFESANSVYISAAYDANAQTIVVSYQDGGNFDRGTVVAGTVSGTSISFETPIVFETGTTNRISSTYDANAQKVVIAYQDSGNSSYGTAVAYQAGYTDANLTSENYIGIAEYAAADTETATVLIKGGVSTTQSSLTPGQTYFVQIDGTLALTADDPSVTAGTAVTSTKLIVKG